MLTSQQRSGLDGPVNRVFGGLGWGESGVSMPSLRSAADPVLHAQEFLRDNGFRMWQKRGRWIAANFARFVEGDRCLLLERTAAELVRARAGTPLPPAKMLAVERRAVDALCQGEWKAAGVGPKQARHILKGVGLAAWTIPLDSRLMRFLWEVAESPDHALPWVAALGDEYTFRMVENWLCELAAGVGITPVAVCKADDGDGLLPFPVARLPPAVTCRARECPGGPYKSWPDRPGQPREYLQRWLGSRYETARPCRAQTDSPFRRR